MLWWKYKVILAVITYLLITSLFLCITCVMMSASVCLVEGQHFPDTSLAVLTRELPYKVIKLGLGS